MMRLIALFAFIILLPISLIISLLIGLSSGFPIVFSQERVGRYKKPFIIHKFKTMVNGKVTTIGRYLRKTGLDEIPQLINIIKGEMTLIGPRPLTQYDITRLKWEEERCKERWSVTPGITGMAQLVNVCDAEVSLKNDLYYAKHKSLKLDIKIFVQSMLIPFIGKQTQTKK